jgi:hypothetical protein
LSEAVGLRKPASDFGFVGLGENIWDEGEEGEKPITGYFEKITAGEVGHGLPLIYVFARRALVLSDEAIPKLTEDCFGKNTLAMT